MIRTVMVLSLVAFVGCASGVQIVKNDEEWKPGKTDPDDVTLYTQTPIRPHTVRAVLEVSGQADFTAEMKAIRESAAKAGCNAVVVTGWSNSPSGYLGVFAGFGTGVVSGVRQVRGECITWDAEAAPVAAPAPSVPAPVAAPPAAHPAKKSG